MLLALLLVPARPIVHRHKWSRYLGEKTFDARMYSLGAINRVLREVLNVKSLTSSAYSVVSILAVWKISRFGEIKSVETLTGSLDLTPCFVESPSQMGQDALTLILCGDEAPKFFVEAGGCDGYFSSNTWLLESQFGWTGIVCEPGRIWHEKLRATRTCEIDTRGLWSVSGERLSFHQTEEPNLSTVDSFSAIDMHASNRVGGDKYEVESVSLIDLLKEHGAPRYIDFLSLDTEGTEFQILKDFPFDRYSFGVIACEHNNTVAKESIQVLLELHGYTYLKELENISLGDAWFVGPHLSRRLAELRSKSLQVATRGNNE
jgi:FkbM family methyltransferase